MPAAKSYRSEEKGTFIVTFQGIGIEICFSKIYNQRLREIRISLGGKPKFSVIIRKQVICIDFDWLRLVLVCFSISFLLLNLFLLLNKVKYLNAILRSEVVLLVSISCGGQLTFVIKIAGCLPNVLHTLLHDLLFTI